MSGPRGSDPYQTGSFTCPHCAKVHPGFVSRCPDTGQAVDRAFRMQGEVLEGKYRVGRMIMSGGMAVVYEGIQVNLERKVAIKFLIRQDHENRGAVQRFRNEAWLAASIGHSHIIDVFDLGETVQGVHYIVMEYLRGRDLGELLIEKGRLPVPVAVGVALQVLGALRAVHAEDIIHRDLKPENVFVIDEPGSEMMVKILDFGISRLAQPDVSLTRSGTVFGSPGYMSPEQARGSRLVDHRADLYSTGVILYEMLTGAMPFDAKGYNEMLIALTTQEPVHVGRCGVAIPTDLQEIVMRAISRDADARYQGADDFMMALWPHGPTDRQSLIPRPHVLTPYPSTPPATGGSFRPPPLVADASPSPPRRTGRPALVVATLVVVLAAASTCIFLLARARSLESMVHSVRVPAPAAAPGSGSAPEVPSAWELSLPGLPEGAAVYVDSTLHPERPVVLDRGSAPRSIRIEAPGYDPWQDRIVVDSDLVLGVTMILTPPPADEPAKKPARKPRIETGDAEPVPAEPVRIDQTYPGQP